MFGPLWWTLEHKGVRFSGFCDMLAGSGLPEEAELWEWMEAQGKLPRSKHHVWVTHYPLFMENLDEPDYEITDRGQYLDWYFGIDRPQRIRLMEIFQATGTDLVVSGHVHCHKVHHAAGVRFEIAPSTSFPQYGDRWPDGDDTLGFLQYEVSDAGIASAFVPLEEVSNAPGYGPGGHVPPAKRDYSLAWER